MPRDRMTEESARESNMTEEMCPLMSLAIQQRQSGSFSIKCVWCSDMAAAAAADVTQTRRPLVFVLSLIGIVCLFVSFVLIGDGCCLMEFLFIYLFLVSFFVQRNSEIHQTPL